MWEEFEALVPTPTYDCPKSKDFVIHLQKLKLFQFLMRLNHSYSQARSQILLMSPMPSVSQAYAMVISDESQKSFAASSGLLGANPTTTTRQYDVSMYTRNGGNYHKIRKNFNLYCEVCKIKGHSRKNYYKIVGYPSGFRSRKKNGNHILPTMCSLKLWSRVSHQKLSIRAGQKICKMFKWPTQEETQLHKCITLH